METVEFEITQPQILNQICPRCRLTWLNKIEDEPTYFCYACQYIMLEKQILEFQRLSK